MRLIFVRHGEPDYKKDSLTENGIRQAVKTAKRLEEEGIKAVYSSPLGRAYETARYTADRLGLRVNTLDFMREIDWGDKEGCREEDALEYEGHPWALAFDLLTKEPDYVGNDKWYDHHFFKDNKCLDCYKYVSENIDAFLENFGFIRKDGLYFCRDGCSDTIALFAHGGSGAVMLSHVLNLPFPFVLSTMPLGLCSVSVIEFWPEKGKKAVPILDLFNHTGHVAGILGDPYDFEK